MTKNKFLILFYFYHLFYILIAYNFIVNFQGDSDLYWFHSKYTENKIWSDFFTYGTDFLLFLNYPLVKFGTSYFLGFLIYGTIGFYGILKWMKWSDLVFGEKFYYKGINLLTIIFFLPNVHFWTATLGKEPLLFFGIASFLYGMASKKYKTFSFITGSFLILIIRPHVAFMLLISLLLVLLFKKKYSIKKHVSLVVIAVVSLSLTAYMILQLSNIKYLNWERIRYYNEFSILSLRKSGSYVPMLEYNYFYKLFSFYFRPLFFDCHSYWMILASVENVFILILHSLALVFGLWFFRKIDFPEWLKIVLLFTFIAGLLYVNRYSNLGIFMRTKIMFQPFVLVGLMYIIKQGFSIMNYKHK